MTTLAVTPAFLSLIALARPLRLSLAAVIVTSKLLAPVVIVSIALADGIGARRSSVIGRRWSAPGRAARTSTEAASPPSRAPASAEAVKTLGSETLGWLNRVPPAIRRRAPEAKLSIAELTCARPETFAWLAVSRLGDQRLLRRLGGIGEIGDQAP